MRVQHLKKRRGFTLVEALISLTLMGILSALSVKLLQPTPRTELWGQRASEQFEYMASLYSQATSLFNRSPLTADMSGVYPDFDNNAGTTNIGLAEYMRQTELLANYCTSTTTSECVGGSYTTINAEYLDYPGGMRLFLKPEQFSFVRTALSATAAAPNTTSRLFPTSALGTNGNPTESEYLRSSVYTAGAVPTAVQEYFLLDMDPSTAPTSLNNPDIVLFRLIDQTGSIKTAAQMASGFVSPDALPDWRTTFKCSFYDVYKQQAGCTAVGNNPT
jgi:prepilin-type N-terminal cleavage/methylation domain-containing protein